jgi:anthranilate phosphoribosyltransferase
MALREAIDKLLGHSDLSSDEASAALEEIVGGDVDASLIAAFLVALRMKGERPDEIAGLARTMRANAVAVTPKTTGLLDTCGTGGSGTGIGNVSTTAALILAGAGVPVAKHGNRALSSKAGSADTLEALGIPLDLSAEQVARCIDEAGIGFMFAAAFHPAMAKVMPVRRALGIRTAFNILGPLTNPARPSFQVVGVGAADLVDLVAGALASLGVERAVVVHGNGGADELTCAGDCIAVFVEDGKIDRRTIRASDAGLDEAPIDRLVGGTAEENARTVRRTLEGEAGPMTDCVLFNAGAAFLAVGRATDIRDGVEQARLSISSGAALEALERFISVANSV